MTRIPDQTTIRQVVDRVIDALGPGANSDDIRQTAARVLERLERPPEQGTVALVDVPAGAVVDPSLFSGLPGVVWARSSVDVPPGDAGAVAGAAAAAIGSLSGPDGRICLTVAPAAPGTRLDWIPEVLAQDPRLRIALVCARPGLGVDRNLLERLIGVRSGLAEAQADRLFAACMRLPVARSGPPRIEILIPATGPGPGQPGDILKAVPAVSTLRAYASGHGVDVSAMLLIPAGTSSDEWLTLRSWRSRFGSLAEPIRGLRVNGWPADGVRPFGDAPLCVSAEHASPFLSSLACGCAQAPVCLSPARSSSNGSAP